MGKKSTKTNTKDTSKCYSINCIVKETCGRYCSDENPLAWTLDYSNVCNEDNNWNFKIESEFNKKKRFWERR